jgi:plasmid stabilization system protein ParE
MDCELIVSKRAQKEIEDAVYFYSERSTMATAQFIENLEQIIFCPIKIRVIYLPV